jgi:hypothetical protein
MFRAGGRSPAWVRQIWIIKNGRRHEKGSESQKIDPLVTAASHVYK